MTIIHPFFVGCRDYTGPDGSRIRSVNEPMGTVGSAGRV
jgi:hypothetical protein